MSNVLVVYGSRYGCAKRVAQALAERGKLQGNEVQLVDAARMPSLEGIETVIVAASIQIGRHPRAVEKWAQRHAEELESRRTLMVSVSMSAMAPAGSESYRGAEACVERFIKRTGFHPDQVALVAGDLPYSKYGFFTRMIMKSIVRREGGPTDTSRDYEFTDWEAVRRLGNDFLATERVAARERSPEPHDTQPSA